MKRFYKLSMLTVVLFLALCINLFSDRTAYAEVAFENSTDETISNDIPTLVETCSPPPGEGGNYPSTSNPTVEIGETFTVDSYVYISAPSVDLEVITIEPESLIEAVDTSKNQYRALSPGTVEMTISYSGQYNCSPDYENTITVSFSGSLQMNVTVSNVTIYLPLIHN